MEMKVTIVYDNEAYKNDLQADWGFSALVEIKNTPKILFDTGADGEILLSNMNKLDIDPKSVEEIFISHKHYDHTGGLFRFLEIKSEVKIYVPPSFLYPPGVKNIIVFESPKKSHNNVISTGEIDGVEQALCVEAKKGIVIIVGCSHLEMEHILSKASLFGKIYGIIGGLHGFHQFDLFSKFKLICATHCTVYKKAIMNLYPDVFIEGGGGKIITL